jgi:hypothetical protein
MINCTSCILGAIYNYLQFLNALTLTQIVITSDCYCQSARQVKKVLGKKHTSFGVLDFVTGVLFKLVQVVIVGLSLLFAMSMWKLGSEKELVNNFGS